LWLWCWSPMHCVAAQLLGRNGRLLLMVLGMGSTLEMALDDHEKERSVLVFVMRILLFLRYCRMAWLVDRGIFI
jgi:hypothetical protein